MNALIPYGRQHITEDDIQAVIETLKSDFLTQGPKVREFEEAFAKYVDANHGIAVNNATSALHLSMMTLGLKPGQKIITTPNTFVASANAALYCGAEVEFADIDPNSFCLDPNQVEDLLKQNPKKYAGIVPVDFAGHPARMADFKILAEKYQVWIIEDASHAPGAAFVDKGGVQKIGNGRYADLTVFSFHPVKHIACGEGGMITTNKAELYDRMSCLRSHGITKDQKQMHEYDGAWDYEMQALGYNLRISDILCALGTSQIKRADESLHHRQKIAMRYNHELRELPLQLPQIEEGSTHAYHLYVIRTERRKELFDFMKSENIHPQVHYTPIHNQPYYISRYGKQHFPNAENYYQKCLSIPMFQSMTEEQQDRVISVIKSFFEVK